MKKHEFQEFANRLAADGKLFHFEDGPRDIINNATGEKVFTDTECEEIETVLADAFNSDFDPMECCLAALGIRDIEQECTFVCDSCGEIIDLKYMVVVPAADDETADHADGWHICRGCAGV